MAEIFFFTIEKIKKIFLIGDFIKNVGENFKREL